MLLRERENQAAACLAKAGVDSPRLSAQALLGHALGLSRLQCVIESARALTQQESDTIERLIRRRATGEPLAHILGHKEFYGRDLEVTTATLIPRPETEMLIDLAVELLPADRPVFFVDLGTGSGCIAVTLACERPRWKGLALDICPKALEVAFRNTSYWDVQERISLLRADMTAVPLAARSCDLVVSNPPYIAPEERGEVMDEVLRFEPHKALFSDQHGLAHIKAVCRQAAHVLKEGGLIMLEHGAGQGEAVRSILSSQGFIDVVSRLDLAGHERCTLARQS